jgi:adenine-specific DNA-methyltransferase
MNKRTILKSLSRSVLLETARTFEVPGISNKKREDIVDALMRIRSLPVEDILATLQVGELKDICREFEIKPESWRKDDIIKVLTADGSTPKPEKENAFAKQEKKTNTIEVVTRKEKSHMARNNSGNQKDVEQYTHETQERLNNPPVGLVTPDTDKDLGKKQYQYDPHLDPQLVWAGKAEHTSFEVPTVSLHVHERIDPKRIIEQVRKEETQDSEQMSLFAAQENPLREAVEFYKHKDGWTNRLIAGDSLLVMNSLLEKEGMGEKVQMVFFDPPYGIKYGSNFQPFVNKRDVIDGKDEDLSAEPEMLKAFRDTWELGIHSYLCYIRDRLLLSKKLLTDNGSVFVQISDENLPRVRCILDEVFGSQNFVSVISFSTTRGFSSSTISRAGDYLCWYAKDKSNIQYNPLFKEKDFRSGEGTAYYEFVELPDSTERRLNKDEISNHDLLPQGSRIFSQSNLSAKGLPSNPQPYKYKGKVYFPNAGCHWKIKHPEGLDNLAVQGRICIVGNTLKFKKYLEDAPIFEINNLWAEQMSEQNKEFVVQTSTKVIQRCILMTTNPGGLVLDITCGSGTTAAVAEQWGRRWITCDTSRIAITLAKKRLISTIYDYYNLAQPHEGISSGFTYRTVPHITLKALSNNESNSQEPLYDQPIVDSKKKRVTGPLTVEAVPAPTVKSFDEIETEDTGISDDSVTRSGETLRQSEWRQELLKTGVRGKNGQFIKFSRIEPMSGTLYIQAEGETTWSDAGAKKGENKGKYQVEVLGFDYYNPKTGNVESGGKHQIAMWMLDTNYDGRSLFPSQVFFPMAGASEGWATLARNLKAEIDEEKIEAFGGTVSLPFESGSRKTVAVKIVDDRGIESLKIMRV